MILDKLALDNILFSKFKMSLAYLGHLRLGKRGLIPSQFAYRLSDCLGDSSVLSNPFWCSECFPSGTWYEYVFVFLFTNNEINSDFHPN